MPKVRSASAIADKWARVTPARAADYESGVRAPTKDWATETKGAEARYEAGVQAAMGRKAFGKGVDKAGSGKWQKKSVELGIPRWGAGVSAAKEDYSKGFAPYRDVIERTTLPPRGAKGSPQNIDRVRVLAMALHAQKAK